MERMPKVVVWDLDGTIWAPEMYQLPGGAPFQVSEDGLRDRRGQSVRLLGDVRQILREFNGQMQFAVASTCDYPDWARECLRKFTVWDRTALGDVFVPEAVEIYYAEDKRAHFQAIARKLNCAFNDMLFFDNEHRNIVAVGALGVTCVHTPAQGVTRQAFADALALWRKG